MVYEFTISYPIIISKYRRCYRSINYNIMKNNTNTYTNTTSVLMGLVPIKISLEPFTEKH